VQADAAHASAAASARHEGRKRCGMRIAIGNEVLMGRKSKLNRGLPAVKQGARRGLTPLLGAG